MNGGYVVYIGEVLMVENLESTEKQLDSTLETKDSSDEQWKKNAACGCRIKVALPQDTTTDCSKLPWCFPLLPKTFQCTPTEHESVLVLCSELGNPDSERFFIGPIISQQNYMSYAPYHKGIGPATSLLRSGNQSNVLPRLSKFSETNGAFPSANDIAIIGRKSEDITLKDGEIDLRCGIRGASTNKNLCGDVVFNKKSPAYIQMKYKPSITKNIDQEANSLVNVVADKINLVSHKDVNAFNLTDNSELMPEAELDEIMSKLHELPYGDLLVRYLKIMQRAILTHGHNFGPAEPPIQGFDMLRLKDIDFDKILSKHVRIS